MDRDLVPFVVVRLKRFSAEPSPFVSVMTGGVITLSVLFSVPATLARVGVTLFEKSSSAPLIDVNTVATSFVDSSLAGPLSAAGAVAVVGEG